MRNLYSPHLTPNLLWSDKTATTNHSCGQNQLISGQAETLTKTIDHAVLRFLQNKDGSGIEENT